jgi:DNA-binding GntR family transcriptional regulator
MALTPARAPRRRPEIALDLRTRQVAVYDTLTTMIGELELEPGTRLVEADLATRFGVSKTPIREAILLLNADGLVRLEPHRGATVTWLSLDEYEELLYIQDALEQPVLPNIAERVTPNDAGEFRRLMERLERAREDHDSRAFFEASTKVHQRLMELAGPIRLARIVTSLQTIQSRRYERAFVHQFDDTWDAELGVMRGRLDGILAGDAEAASAAVRAGRQTMRDLTRSRLDDPRIARYLAPAASAPKRRASAGRRAAGSRGRCNGSGSAGR